GELIQCDSVLGHRGFSGDGLVGKLNLAGNHGGRPLSRLTAFLAALSYTTPWDCSGLLIPDTDLGENPADREVSDEQTTSFLYARVQTGGCQSGAPPGLQPYRSCPFAGAG